MFTFQTINGAPISPISTPNWFKPALYIVFSNSIELQVRKFSGSQSEVRGPQGIREANVWGPRMFSRISGNLGFFKKKIENNRI